MSATSVEWLMYEPQTSKCKEVSRLIEMTIEDILPLPYMLQFCDDVELYGMFRAVGMVPEDHEGSALRDRVMEALLVDFRLAALPKITVERMVVKPEKTSSKVGTLRPESIWALQKHLILEKPYGESVKRVMESVLPFSAPEGVPRPYTSQDYIEIAKSTSVWYAVTQAPIRFREALAQRLLVTLDIPEPAPPKDTRHKQAGVAKPSRDKVLVIDKAGNAWTWNIGWYRVGEDGVKLDDRKPLGHAAFKRCITPAGPEDYARQSFRYTRPWGQWRKGNGPVYHDVYKMNGDLILTDGMHAVVLFSDGIKREVMLDNLQSIAEKSHRVARTQDSKTPRASKPTKKELTLEEMMKML